MNESKWNVVNWVCCGGTVSVALSVVFFFLRLPFPAQSTTCNWVSIVILNIYHLPINVFEWSESAVYRVPILPIVVVPFCVYIRVLRILLLYIIISSPSVQYVTAFPVVKSAPNWQRHHTNGTPDAAIVLLILARHLQSDCPVCCSRSSGGDGGGSFNRLSRHVVLIVA